MMSVTFAGLADDYTLDKTDAFGFIEWSTRPDEYGFSTDLPTSDSITDLAFDATTDSIYCHPLDYSLLLLQIAADNNNEATFIRIYQEIDWDKRSAEDILATIDLALAVGAFTAARNLAQKGFEKFPGYADLQKISAVLAPPQTSVSNRKPNPGIRANRDWLRSNRAQYLGSWVALENGELLYSAHSADEIIAEIGDLNNKNVLVTKVY